jgi:antibiotic biosynthesis monooxygenase (ABM) superfamily enzyme
MPRSFKAGRLTFCMLVFAAVYPLVTGLAYLTQDATRDWEIWQRHLIVVPIIVCAMVFVIIPNIQRLLAHLSEPADPLCARSRKENQGGADGEDSLRGR